MACSKYNLTNTGSTIVTFNYRRCDDSLWENQVELLPGQTKNIWVINGTYSIAPQFLNNVVFVNEGVFPPPQPSPTPTPTPTLTSTPTNTPTLTSTSTPTPTSTNTPTLTSTSTPTPSPTLTSTPTETPIIRYTQAGICHSEINFATICGCPQNATIFTNGSDLASSTLAWADSAGPNTGNPKGWYLENDIIYEVLDDCGIGCSTGSTVISYGACPATPTPTPTPTLTSTPTNTPTLTSTQIYFSFLVSSGSTSNDACNGTPSETIWGNNYQYDNCTNFYVDDLGNTGLNAGFYSTGTIVVELDSNGAEVGGFTACAVLPTSTPTNTPTLTSTPTPTLTQTLGYYSYNLSSGATSNDACIGSTNIVYGELSAGPGPNIGEILYQTPGNPPSDPVADGYYSDGTSWWLVSGGNGEVTSNDPNGCII